MIGLRIAFSALSFVLTLLLARFLGPRGFGTYSYAFAWIVLLGIPAILGLDQLLVRDVATYLAASQWGNLRGLLRNANGAVLKASLALVLLAGAVAWLIGRTWPAQLLPTFLTALVILPLIALTRVRQAAMQGLHHVALGTVPEQLIQPALQLTLVLLAHYFLQDRFTAPQAMGLNVGASAIAFLIGAQFLSRILPQAVQNASPVYQRVKWMQSALPLLFLASAGVLFAQADTLILGALKGPAAVGTYSVAHKGADIIGFILIAQNAALASTAASLYAAGNLVGLQRLVTRLTRWTLLGSAPIAFGLIVFGRWFLVLYGPAFAQAQETLAILSFGQLLNVAFGSVGMLLTMTGNERTAATAIAAGAAANIALNFTLIPRWGAQGAAVAYSASMLLWNVWMAISLYRKVGLSSTAAGRMFLSKG